MESSPSKSKVKSKAERKAESFDTMEQSNFSSSVIVLIAKIVITAVVKFWRACTAGLLILMLSFWLYGSWMCLSLLMIAVLGFLYNAQDMLLYHPEQPDNARIYVESPAVMGLPFENIFIKTSDGERINLVFIKQPANVTSEAPTVIFFHGNAGNIGHRLMNAYTLFTYCGCNVVLVEYRGFGKSSGRPSEAGLYRDAEASINYISKRTDIHQEKLVVFGRSLGGAVALYIASVPYYANKVSCVIVENTFLSIPDIGRHIFDIRALHMLPFWCYKNKYLSRDKVRDVQLPTLFISGLADTLVPPGMMHVLYELSGSNMKRIARLEGGTHNETWQCPGYYDAINRFLTEVKEYESNPGIATSAAYRMNIPFHDGSVPMESQAQPTSS